ncbi:D-2-hydroxyacid dehydrogenase [Salipaludibacillus sp. CF4.18]|uniref:D-2-hydroxyacid dehydrogenase n=1 Tax=Salipaludibacillus sp. CF4.18 TaxID=3373081 RepID=UPI003EE80499
MLINNILFASPMHNELEKLLKDKEVYQTKQFRFCSEENVTMEDYKWADAFVSFKRPGNFLFENIKWVHSLGAGVDKLLDDSEWKKDVLLTRTISSFGQKISEYCLSYILRDTQNHEKYSEMNVKNDWNPIPPTPMHEKHVVIYGTGVIGQEVAKSLSYLGVKVDGVSLSGNANEHFKNVYSSKSNYFHVLSKADYIINTMPLTKDTKLLFNTSLFSQCTNTVFINVGRGESVDNHALLEALDSGNINSAILDVFQKEPLPKKDLFWTHSRVIVTPHISAVTTPEEGLDCFLDTLHTINTDRIPSNIVDVEKGF